MRRSIITLLALVPASAIALGQPSAGPRKAEPRVITQHAAAMPGQTVLLGLDFEIEPGWHTYWPGINDSGLALDAEIEVSEGASVGELRWPAPHRYSPSKGILDHVFEERVTVLLPVTIDENARPGEEIRLRMDLSWLSCKEACIFESAELTHVIAVGDAAGRPDRETVAAFEEASKRLPRPIKADDGVRLTLEDDRLEIRAIGADRLAFYPWEDSRSPRDLLAEGESEGDSLSIAFRASDSPISGVLEVWRATEKAGEVYEVHWPPKQQSERGDPEAPAPADP